ncbi:hypothetical protein [Sphingobacterium sp. IITKGP-BTPF85]|uniref:hypothetical protein n=1 Tax=Sphingobacterium sp. IITKGP-BTPF85 TaxID=1338009 RepID=UPI000389EBA2|nr:hypothetical protein [Sphingobacterium sp. IITKGP-BTPF85]KKX48344.1 hypothetical protein L950_0221570 [Sphingobacterium sp. IITKGP-BTPF85]
MALTIIQQPHNISPNSNINAWVLNSNNNNFIYVIAEITATITGTLITRKKIFPKPFSSNVVIELSSILESICESILLNSDELITKTNLPAYNITFKEYVIDSSTGVITATGNDLIKNNNYFFESQENIIDFASYTANKYNINTTDTKALFLTNQPSLKNTTTLQKENLKIFDINNIAKKIKIMLYDSDNDFLKDFLIDIPVAGNVINLNITPSIVLNHPLIKNTDEALITNIYKIVLLDINNKEVTEPQIIRMLDACNKKETNIVYKNTLGGWDSLIFNSKIETIGINKTYFNKQNNSITYSQDGKYVNNKELIKADTTYTYTASSDLLDDFESKQIKELLTSNKVYAVVNNLYVEISIDNKSYKVLQRHTNGYKKTDWN